MADRAPTGEQLQQAPTPTTVSAPQPAPASPQIGQQQGPGTQRLALYLKQPKPDPVWVAAQLRYYPDERVPMMALMQSTVGNSFVQRVIAADQGGTATAPITFEPDGSALPPTISDGTVVDGGSLGPVISASATAKAEVDLPSVEAAVTSVANMQQQLTISPAIPLAAIHAGQMLPADIAQITNVTMIGSVGGTVSYQVVNGVLQLALSGVSSVKALEATTFKLWLAYGQSIALTVKATMFHLETGVLDRGGTSAEIANEQQVIASERADEANAQKSALAAGHAINPSDQAWYDSHIASSQAWLDRDNQELAGEQGKRYVNLDANGSPINTAAPTSAPAATVPAAATATPAPVSR